MGKAHTAGGREGGWMDRGGGADRRSGRGGGLDRRMSEGGRWEGEERQEENRERERL